jgi:4-hydroxythreonine-4-phosphate dehydrogenase
MWIGMTVGDPTGVGPEVTLKALVSHPFEATRFLLLGNPSVLGRANEKIGLPLTPFTSFDSSCPFAVLDPSARVLPSTLTCGAPEAALAAVDCLRKGAELCLKGHLAGLVTAPVSKESIIRAGIPFVGQTEFLSELAGVSDTVMMLLGEDGAGRWLRVALVTTHLPIRKVADAITRAKVELAIRRAIEACADLGLPRSRVGVCGLNPHAGEGGKLGTEDVEMILPAVDAARAKGADVVGPIAADTLFHYAYKGEYDAVVAMYHDQGLAPLKMIGFDRGVNWTLGLPFIRTSPDHGTAYDIAGRDLANPSSMVEAIRLARRLAGRGAS